MRYLLMCYIDEAVWGRIPEPERNKILKEYHDLMQETMKTGNHRGGAMLGPTATAITVRSNNGTAVVTDGPFAETKEQFGGYHLMEFEDLEEAIAIASRIPTIRVGGTIEIRPVEMLEN